MDSVPNTNVTPTPNPNTNQEYTNTVDGQTYTVKQAIPGQGSIVVNKNTQQESMIPEAQMNAMQQTNQSSGQGTMPGLKPVLKTSIRRDSMHTDLDDIDSAIQDDDIQRQGIEGDINSIIDGSDTFDSSPKQHLERSIEQSFQDPTDVVNDVELPAGVREEAMSHDDREGLNTPLGLPEVAEGKMHPLSELPKNLLASTRSMMKVDHKSRSWRDIRAAMPEFGPKNYEERQMVHLKNSGLSITKLARGISFSPTSRNAGDSGHSKINNIPVEAPRKEKDMVIGMTEFPKGQKRDDSVGLDTGKGYNVTMKEMDEHQVADREKFENEKYQFVTHMTIQEFRDILAHPEKDEYYKGRGLEAERERIKPDDDPLYDVEKTAILQYVGLSAIGDIEMGETTQKKSPETPVTLEERKVAPKSDSYTEPALIPPAKGKEKEAITKLLATQEELKQLKDNLSAALKPHQESIKREQDARGPAIKSKEEMLTSYIEMAYKQIDLTAEKVVYYAKTIWARLQEPAVTKPQVTVAQVIDEALKLDAELANTIKEIKEKLETAQGGEYTKRRLYEFPVTPSTEKKLAPEASMILVSALHESLVAALARFVAGLAQIDEEIESSLEMLGA
jgi:hypothetical protein